MQMTLPKMDVPVNVVEWELFVPDRFRVDRFAGDMFDATLMSMPDLPRGLVIAGATGVGGGRGGSLASRIGPLPPAQAGQINGHVVDSSGLPIPGVAIVVDAAGVKQTVYTDAGGAYVASNVPSGTVTLTGELSGFASSRRRVQFDQRGQQVDLSLAVGNVSESVTVTAESPVVNTSTSETSYTYSNNRNAAPEKTKVENEAPSANVQNLQRRASGVLPVRMEVPRAGTSHRFVKPLVIDEETTVTFRYKRR